MLQDLSPSKTLPLRRTALILAAVLILSSRGLFQAAQALGQAGPLGPGEKAVALVNGFPIYPSDLNCALEASLARNRDFHGEPDMDGQGVLERLIDIELLYQESLKHRFPGIVEESERIFQEEITRAGGLTELQYDLACNGISIESFRQAIFRNVSIRRLLTDVVYSRIRVSQSEITEYYAENISEFRVPESVQLRQIFIRIPPSTDQDTLRETEDHARGVFTQASRGEDFLSLARKYSDDPDGGEMGVIFKGNLHKTFETLVFGVREGSVTEPVRSIRGYHIFQVVSFSPSSPLPLEEVRETIARRITRLKARDMVSDFLSSLRKKARILILDEEAWGKEHPGQSGGVPP